MVTAKDHKGHQSLLHQWHSLKMKAQNKFKIAPIFNHCAGLHNMQDKKKQKTLAISSIWQNKMHASFWEIMLNKSNANSGYAIYNTPISNQ